MKKEFKFKETDSNVEKLYSYALYKFPQKRRNLEYDEIGQFVFYKKDKNKNIFYFLKNSGILYFAVYENCELKKEVKIISDFKEKVYKEEKLKEIFDKLLSPLNK